MNKFFTLYEASSLIQFLKSAALQAAFVFVLVASVCSSSAQVRRLGVLGSSSANGQGVPADSSWAQKLKKHYRNLALIDTLQSIAASTFDCYSGMPTGYVPPAGRNSPNISYNITRLMSRTPMPTTIVVSYPNTNYNIFSDQEILFCLDSIKKYANSMGAVCFIATTQPRDNYNDSARARLKYLNDLIKQHFGFYAIDCFTPLNNPVNNKLKAEYVLGDGVHINAKGHEVLFQEILKKNILNVGISSIQRVLIDVGESTSQTSQPDQWNKYWNNMTDGRAGQRINNAVTTNNLPTTIKLDVLNPIGTTSATNPGVGTSGAVGNMAEYPASATNGFAIANSTITNGRWRIHGLDPTATYHVRFWGSHTLSGYRILQVKRTDELVWQEYNASLNKNYTNAATFAFTGKSEMSFDLKVKAGSASGHVSVIDIVRTFPADQLPVNQLPVAVAGEDTSVILPVDSVRLYGGASFDPDGDITGYEWRKVSGPSSYSISNNAVANPLLRNLVAGNYAIELKVTDNGGLFRMDTVQVTVNSLKPPVANAGPDANIFLPGNISLSGSGSDVDGTIISFRWRKVGGPLSYVFSDSTIASPIVKNVSAGIYSFELNVTDNSGLSGKDTVNITVNPASVVSNQRVLIDAGLSSGQTASPDQWGKYWNNMTDARQGLRINNALATNGSPTTIKLEVINAIGSINPSDLNTRTSNSIGIVGEYPASATNDNAFAYRTITNGRWRIYGLAPGTSYTIKFWGSYSLAESRAIQIKRTDEATWKEYNAAMNKNVDSAAVFTFSGKSEVVFDIRIKPGNNYGHINVIDILAGTPLNQAPVANAGIDIAIILPKDTVQLNGAASSDSDGTIMQYAWRKIGGPSSYTISNSTIANPVLKNLVAGIYAFELKVTDDGSMSTTDTVRIVVSLPKLNTLPVADAGRDTSIILPVNTGSLHATGSFDSDGVINSYKWKQVGGDATPIIAHPDSAHTSVTFSTAGEYLFELVVTDDSLGTGKDTMKFTIYSPNQVPKALAGVDGQVTLPVNSYALNGSSSVDADGNIASFSWKKVSGPSTGFVSDPSSAQTTAVSLVAGIYTFELSVTDNQGAIGIDSINVTVYPATNQSPVASAGNDTSIFLPINTLQLAGKGSDPDGGIASFAWSKISGPSSYSLSNPGIANPVVSNLSQGVYGFELTVTDSGGSKDKDTVNVTVNPGSLVTNQRVLIDAGQATVLTNSPDQWGKYWNNLTDVRKGLRINNAVSTSNVPTTIKLEVVNAIGTTATYDPGTSTSGAVGIVGEYPASATNDNTFAHSSIANGRWRFYGLEPAATYVIKFWGSQNLSGNRFLQIKRSDETTWKEYNASLNKNFDSSASFTFTGKTEMMFDIRVKAGSSYSYINVIDIAISSDTGGGNPIVTGFNNTFEEGVTQNHAIVLYPNPTVSSSIMRMENQYTGSIEISTSNQYGQVIRQERLHKTKTIFLHDMHLEGLLPGIYFTQVKMGNKTEITRILKF